MSRDTFPPVDGVVPAPGYRLPPDPVFHDVVDARRSMWRRTPDSEFPDGYLGTITTRRGDRMLNALKGRLNQRNYQRGVHKGEKIDPGDYFWPPELNMMSGIRRQAVTDQRFAPIEVGAFPHHLTAEGKMPLPRGAEGVISVDPKRAKQLQRLAPSWR